MTHLMRDSCSYYRLIDESGRAGLASAASPAPPAAAAAFVSKSGGGHAGAAGPTIPSLSIYAPAFGAVVLQVGHQFIFWVCSVVAGLSCRVSGRPVRGFGYAFNDPPVGYRLRSTSQLHF